MDKKDYIENNIELHSEKVRNLLGDIPPALVRWGIIIIAIVFTALIATVCLFPCPYSTGESIIKNIFEKINIQP